MILLAIITLFYFYHLVWLFISLAITRTPPTRPAGEGKSRFAVLFPAHNEERVIAASIASVKNCRYPKELFDVYVIADNCTDRTAALARQAGAIALERQDPNRGKQHALKWAFNAIDLEKYDAVVILDADNRVDPGFLSTLDSELQKGHKVVQGYLETLNPNDSWITANYAYMFWYICRLNMARSLMGLSSWLAGTGFCISTEVIKRIGWQVETLTDDVEYTCQLILAGERIKFAPGAVVYDQKPQLLGNSMRQRLRWIRGQTQVTMRYLPRLAVQAVRALLAGKPAAAIQAMDGIMWVPMHLVVLASAGMSLALFGWQYLLSVLVTAPIMFILPMVAERVKNGRAWVYLVTAGAFFFTWLPVTAYGVVTCGEKSWWRTPH
ncbi:glycosyltransferase family 2 protein [Moorella sp. ACPs]|uniref:glycosyltransferase family 2 protein n=1 Tax=Neomoorella carbonis TaxID=3062783 RepID=UPI0032569618